MPDLEFRFDQTVEQHDRIERIIQEIHEADALRPEPPPDAEAPVAGPDKDDDPDDA
jgi:hypothetical protein